MLQISLCFFVIHKSVIIHPVEHHTQLVACPGVQVVYTPLTKVHCSVSASETVIFFGLGFKDVLFKQKKALGHYQCPEADCKPTVMLVVQWL